MVSVPSYNILLQDKIELGGRVSAEKHNPVTYCNLAV